MVIFVLRVDKVLNLGHCEFPDSQESRARGNLVSESKADLCGSKRHSPSVVLKEPMEIEEHALSCFRPQVTNQISTGANISFEHQVEGFGRTKLIPGLRVFYFMLLNDDINFFLRHGLHVGEKFFKLSLFVALEFSLILGQLIFCPFSDEFVSANSLPRFDVFYHQVCELGDVA